MKRFFAAEKGHPPTLVSLAIVLLVFCFGVTAFAFFNSKYAVPDATSYGTGEVLVLCIQLILSGGAVALLVFATRQIKYLQQRRKELTDKIVNSHRAYLFNNNSDDDVDDQEAVEKLTSSLKQAVSFTQQVARGASDAAWVGISDDNRDANQSTLAGELIRMRMQRDEVRAEDQKRLWNTEGASKVAEITRQHQGDVQQLADQLLTYLVRYVKANQAMLFFWDEEAQHLALVSCHAYDKKKFVKRQVAPGEGLVGQTYLEQETTHLTEIPVSYSDITSGLGKAAPQSLLLVPLKANEQTIGILELASFGTFAEHVIAFLEDAGEIIASSVATAQLNQRTQLLLAQSKQQAEEMRAQEEEMRQNLEELQATQEEMERKAQELFRAKQELEEKNQEAETIRAEEQKRAEEQIQARNKMLIEAKKRFDQRERELLDQLNAKN
jgi:hypothetical protein